VHACTIIAKNYLAYARVLARSFAEHHPDGTFSVLVIDDFTGLIDPQAEPFELLRPDAIGCEEFEPMAARYDVLELSTAVKPWLLGHLLDRGAETITYLDPDIRIFAPLTALEQLGREHGLVLTPHNTVPIPFDGERPSQVDIMISGVFNLGYVTLARGSQSAELLDWWSERLVRDCRVDPVYGYFVDQRWMDLVPGLAADYAVVRDPEYNVAYWNLHARDLQHDGERYTVDGRPLAFFHFSGFDPDRRANLSRHQTRIRLDERPALSSICVEYADALLVSDHRVARSWPYGYSALPDGTEFNGMLRRLFAAGEQRGTLSVSPFSETGYKQFVAWLGGHDEDQPLGMTRILSGLYQQRPDLQRAYPNLAGEDRAAFLNWVREKGIAEAGLPERFVPPPGRRHGVPWAPAGSSDAAGPGVPEPNSLVGVNVVGYFRSELGVGEAARQVVSALDSVSMPLLPLHGRTVPLSRQQHEFAHLELGEARFPINLICMNADALPEFAEQAGPEFFAGRYSIGMWFRELAAPPPGKWHDAFAVLDEVWAPSNHVAQAISRVADVPVIRVPLPLSLPLAVALPRHALDLPEHDFVFLFSFDDRSVFERKNPLALIETFKAAFAPGSGASLVIKTINGDSDLPRRERLRAAAADRPDIRVIEDYLTPEAKNSLVAACDCYVSLHRAEGFGLTLAEAMYLGKPVIATGYSGNVDFMSAQNSYLVDYRMVPVGPDAAPYPPDGEWAEPSAEHAVALMREVFDDRAGARERGRRAAEDIRRTHSPEACGQQMVSRLERSRERAIAQGRQAFFRRDLTLGAVEALASVQARVQRGPTPRRPESGARTAAHRILLRAMKPFTAYQSAVNAELVTALRGVDGLQGEDAVALAVRLREARSAAQVHAELARRQDELSQGVQEMLALRQPIIERLDELSANVQRVDAEHHAVPFMEGSPFTVRHDPIAGAVLGYETANGEPGEAYRSFEDVFRGSERMIRERQRRYLPIIGELRPVLDFGCGRGELLDLLREANVPYLGVDSDESMVTRCHRKGHVNVVYEDGLKFLAQQSDASLGVIFAAQVIEHMTEEQLRTLLRLSRAKLKGDGLLILETVNPHSPPALKAFWVDLTHQQPIFPEVALELCREGGFGSAYVFHPNGSGDIERDRFVQGEFAVVARAGAAGPAPS
jgi:glycosyltransferase involved in cell wall biosynthesis/SAM-dependent methyltransferase